MRHSLAQLYISADRLSRLVRQLLSLARNEPGALDSMQLQPLDLNAHALEVSMDWVPQALKRNIDLGFEGADHPLMIDADQDRLRELVNNLIDNAIRYSQPGGRVTVQRARPERRRNAAWPSATTAREYPSRSAPAIFERFHRLLGTQEDGSGLGLAIVSEIATLHGARITLEEDADGVGNTFSVFFPLRPADPQGSACQLPDSLRRPTGCQPAGKVTGQVSTLGRGGTAVVPDPYKETPCRFLSSPDFWIALSQIILINIVLSGDNAVVIAMASPLAAARPAKEGHPVRERRRHRVARDPDLLRRLSADPAVPQARSARALFWIGIGLLTARTDEESHLEGHYRPGRRHQDHRDGRPGHEPGQRGRRRRRGQGNSPPAGLRSRDQHSC